MRPQALKAERLAGAAARLYPAAERRLTRSADRLGALGRVLQTLDPKRPPRPGFALVRRPDGSVVTQAAGLNAGDAIQLTFGDGDVGARVDGEAPKPKASKPAKPGAMDQGNLF
jgi:exodeoxyribonuclease VII large subunit